MAGRIFISYSKEQPEPTKALAAFLTGKGYSVWWDANLTSGERFRDAIDREIEAADAAIVIWTPHSITSEWVISEADHAKRRGKLITVRTRELEPWRIPKPYNTYHADIIDDPDAILTSVRRIAGEPPSPKPSPGGGLSEQSIQEALALEHWQAIKDRADPVLLRTFLSDFASSKCASLAVAQLRALASAAWKKVSQKNESDLSAFVAEWPEAAETALASGLISRLQATRAAAQAKQQKKAEHTQP